MRPPAVFEQSCLGSDVVATNFLLKGQALDGFWCLIASLDTPALIDVFIVSRSATEVDLPPNQFVGSGALGYTKLTFCNDVDGNYPFGGTDVCPCP